MLINTAAHHWTTLYRQWHYTQLRNLAGFLWFVGAVYHWVSRLVTLPERAWRRLSLEGPTKLTVSSAGLSWCNSNQRQQLGWDQYYGYVVLPEELIFVSRMPYIVPRSTVSPVDFERVLTIAKQHLPAREVVRLPHRENLAGIAGSLNRSPPYKPGIHEANTRCREQHRIYAWL